MEDGSDFDLNQVLPPYLLTCTSVSWALTVMHLSLLSMNSLNQTEIAVFTLPLQCLLPEDHITRIYILNIPHQSYSVKS